MLNSVCGSLQIFNAYLFTVSDHFQETLGEEEQVDSTYYCR